MTVPAVPAAGAVSPLSDVHRQYLNEHAMSDAVIEAQGIRSEGDDIVFTWREGGHVTEQRRPWPGPSGQYYWTKDADLHLNIIRDPGPDAPVLLCEGTKQSLAVASWAPPQYAVMGMPGCYGWTMSRKLDLARFAGRQVFILLDADAASNLDVYEAGERLASELDMEDPPATAKFIPSPAWGKDGIDDYLGRIATERRSDRLVKLIGTAQDKPADKKPTKRKSSAQQPDTQGRPMILVNVDRRQVIQQILGTLRGRWDGRDLFCYGGALTRLRDGATEPLSRDAFLRWLAEGVACFRQTLSAGLESCWPDNQTVGAVLASSDEFAQLNRVVKMPFIRGDGSVCAKNGYDAATGTFLVMGNSGMDRLDIPDAPSQAESAAAARWLLDEWLGDMPFRDDASKANALGLVITPFIRGLVPLVPLAVVSGLQIGVGKNLLADCFSTVMTGTSASPLQWIPDDDDEVRKQLLSAFRQGDSLICFDEAHVIGGAALSRALTALTYTDRILGVSQMASFPNQATWLALGNQVQLNADMSRRGYWIELYPSGPNPQDRDESSFTHPDLRGWTAVNRPEIVTKVLTVLRAWFVADCPAYSRGSLMGSFETWDKMISGILGHARVTGFLANTAERRAQSDFTGGYWSEHLAWLHDVFGNGEFTLLQVKAAATASSGLWTPPPGLDDTQDRSFARKLGQAYARNRERWFGGYRLLQVGKGHNNVVKWRLAEFSEDTLAELGGGQQGGNKEDERISEGFGREGGFSNDTPSLSSQNSTGGTTGGWSGGNQFRYPPTSTLHELQKEPLGGNGGNKPLPPLTRTPAHDARTHTRGYAHEENRYPLTPVTPQTPPVALQPPLARNGLTLTVDLETASADKLFTYTQRDETGFVRLAGAIGPAGDPVIMTGAELVPLLDHATEITGHNILGFDLLALARHHGAQWNRLAAKTLDTELITRQVSPPRSKESGQSEDKYDLDHVAAGLGVPGKTDSIAALKRKHGGYDQIPLDDPDYRSYLDGDLRATAAVSAALAGYYRSDPYLAREHRLAAIAGQMTLNGFRVDEKLLSERLAAGQGRKAEALELLHAGWGLPLTKTVTRGRGAAKTETEQEVASPLSTDAGRAWLATQYERYGIDNPPVTQKAGKLALGVNDLKPLLDDPRSSGELRAMLQLMGIVTTTRTVYQTASDCLTSEGRVHPGNSFRQASGRWSVTNPGLTVFGKRGGRHVERDIFLPDPGHVLLSFDLSQVDMRSMAGHCQDPGYMAIFQAGRDAHQEIADQVGVSRQDAKAIGHGWNYGLGAKRMIANGLDPEKVYKFIEGMEQRFPRLIAWREQIREQGKAGEILDNGFGRRMRCDPGRAYTVAPALMGQGGARDIMGECLLRLPAEILPMLRVMVHDEIVISCPNELVWDVIPVVKQAMTWTWRDVPVTCDMAFGLSWGEASAK